MGDLVKSTLGPKGMDKILQSAYVCLDHLDSERGTDQCKVHGGDYGHERRSYDFEVDSVG